VGVGVTGPKGSPGKQNQGAKFWESRGGNSQEGGGEIQKKKKSVGIRHATGTGEVSKGPAASE